MGEPLSLKEHQDIMLRLLVEFDAFCKEHKLRYYLAFGTLLGAVRHHGFIPWDDDADVVMPRPDFEKLLRFDKISDKAQIVSTHNNQGYYHPFLHANIADTETIMVEHTVKKSTGKGVFIDIFPLDGLPEDKAQLHRHTKKLMRLQSMLSNKLLVAPGFSSLRNAAKSVLGWAMCLVSDESLISRIEDTAKKYSYDDSSFVAQSVALDKQPYKFVTPREAYGSALQMEFEGHRLAIPAGYEAILRSVYGNYMVLPPESERRGHHGIEIYKR